MKIIEKIIKYWIVNGIIKSIDRDIYEYGLELILSSTFNAIVVIFSSIFVNRLAESIVLLIVIILLQSCGGGFHAKTHSRCFMIMYIGWWLVVWIIPYISFLSAILIVCASLITILILAPVRHENVPMSEKHFLKMKILVRCFTVATALLGITILCFHDGRNNIGNSVIVGLCVVAISIVAAKIRNYIINP